MNDWAAGDSGVSSIVGWTRNPYDLDRDPGGSSSGTGAAVAANLATVGIELLGTPYSEHELLSMASHYEDVSRPLRTAVDRPGDRITGEEGPRYRATVTGTDAFRTTVSATLPSRMRVTPSRPWLPMTMWSTSWSSA